MSHFTMRIYRVSPFAISRFKRAMYRAGLRGKMNPDSLTPSYKRARILCNRYRNA